jgi:hypothetical protein
MQVYVNTVPPLSIDSCLIVIGNVKEWFSCFRLSGALWDTALLYHLHDFHSNIFVLQHMKQTEQLLKWGHERFFNIPSKHPSQSPYNLSFDAVKNPHMIWCKITDERNFLRWGQSLNLFYGNINKIKLHQWNLIKSVSCNCICCNAKYIKIKLQCE